MYTDRNSCRRMVKNEGFLTVYQGLGAGIVRQIFYATSRFGLYEVTPCTPCVRARRTRATCSQAHTQAYATASCCAPLPSRLPCAQLRGGPPTQVYRDELAKYRETDFLSRLFVGAASGGCAAIISCPAEVRSRSYL